MNISMLLILAIIHVESGGDLNAIGDGGDSRGCMQIQAGVITDVNQTFKTNYSWPKDTLSKEKSIELFRKYMARYATKKRLGREPTLEDYARIWNGGPNGYKKKATLDYWRKVKARMKELSKNK